ncbi:hypothetical protein [Listeria booriae]|uniref:hypothetical protein n=1 Tax=Listeria booriae TaxID=1552123 RepID=UPI00162A9C28|nr:hypothetical protein [Listeria booriae]MBC2392011.1 hypothetical protein [Listeria booriae]
MNKVQMGMLSVLSQVGFSEISKSKVKEQIEANFPAKEKVIASVNTLKDIEDKYKKLIAQVTKEAGEVQAEYSKLVQEINELDMTSKGAVSKVVELESEKTQLELKLQASNKVIKAMTDKKFTEFVAELPNTFNLGIKGISEAYQLEQQLNKIVNPFNEGLIIEVLTDIDKEMDEVDRVFKKLAKETETLGKQVEGVTLHDRDFGTHLAYRVKVKK